jgi:hypothetical protein
MPRGAQETLPGLTAAGGEARARTGFARPPADYIQCCMTFLLDNPND